MDRVDHALLVAPKHNNTILIILQHVHVHGLTGYPLLPLGDGLPGGPGGPYKENDNNIEYTHTHTRALPYFQDHQVHQEDLAHQFFPLKIINNNKIIK